MSYAASAALQVAIYDCLTDSSAPAILRETPVVDQTDDGPLPDMYIAIGADRVRSLPDSSGISAEHLLTISVTGTAGGFHRLKRVAGALSEHLETVDTDIGPARVRSLRFVRARARRGPRGATRSIELTFRAFIDDL